MKVLLACAAASAALLTGCSGSAPSEHSSMASQKTSDSPLASAMSAAPKSVSHDATVVSMDAKGAMKTLRKGTNGWTCMPDTPQTPGPDPMCVDAGGMTWAMAWMSHTDPPKGTTGFGYMLMGGSDPSNSDPFAAKPASGQKWVKTGPHVMVFNTGSDFAGYPTTADNPKAPYVMYPNTPYAHLMVPVK